MTMWRLEISLLWVHGERKSVEPSPKAIAW